MEISVNGRAIQPYQERVAPTEASEHLQRCSDRGRRSLAAHLGHYRQHHDTDPQDLRFTHVNMQNGRTLNLDGYNLSR